MKKVLLVFTLFLFIYKISAQEKKDLSKAQIVEASCGQCNFGLKGKTCDLAVRIDGKAYFVDGTKIDDHGDAHSKDGFCLAIRKAEVKGDIINDRFVASYFKLIDETKLKN
jgi:hypothetical protein